MKKLFILIIISACFLFSGCVNRMASKIIDNWEAQTLKKLENPDPEEEPKLYAQLADIYNAKAQYLMVNEPKKQEEAESYLQQSIETCQRVMQEFSQAYANDEFVSIKINLTMANNMFLQGNQGEVEQWCSRLPENVACPQILKELQQ